MREVEVEVGVEVERFRERLGESESEGDRKIESERASERERRTRERERERLGERGNKGRSAWKNLRENEHARGQLSLTLFHQSHLIMTCSKRFSHALFFFRSTSGRLM